MSLILIKNKRVASLEYLHLLALKKVFSPLFMHKDEQRLLEDSLIAWPTKLHISDAMQRDLEDIACFLMADVQGKLEAKKETIVKHKIDYVKFYRGRVPSLNPFTVGFKTKDNK